MTDYKYRLWLAKDGKPSVLQFLDDDATPEEAIEMAKVMGEKMRTQSVLIVGPQVEVVSA